MHRLTIWLSLLTGALVVLVIGVIVGLAALGSDIAQLDTQVTALKYGAADSGGAIGQLPPLGGGTKSGLKSPPIASGGTNPGATPANFKAQIDNLQTISGTLHVSLTVQFSGPADLLYQPPIVQDAQGTQYHVTPDSLKAARFALLDLTTAGQATATFVFQPVPAAHGALTFVFNPEMPAGDNVAPRIEVPLRKE